jgi:hypothetical protein
MWVCGERTGCGFGGNIIYMQNDEATRYDLVTLGLIECPNSTELSELTKALKAVEDLCIDRATSAMYAALI